MQECLCLSASRWFPGNQRGRGGIRAGVPQPASKTWGPQRSAAKTAPAHLPPGTSWHPRDPPPNLSILSLHSLPGSPRAPPSLTTPPTSLCYLTLFSPLSGLCPAPCPAQERLKKPEVRKGNTVEKTDEKSYLSASECAEGRVVWPVVWVGQIGR